MTAEFTNRISPNEEDFLRGVVGSVIRTAYARQVEVSDQGVWARAHSLFIAEGKFLVLESDWSDTPTLGLDYHMLEVAASDWPKGIGRVKQPQWKFAAQAYSSSIRLSGDTSSPIAAVQVLESEEVEDEESVHFDSGLLFHREDGSRFLFYPPNGILGGLLLSSDPAIIDEQLASASAVRGL